MAFFFGTVCCFIAKVYRHQRGVSLDLCGSCIFSFIMWLMCSSGCLWGVSAFLGLPSSILSCISYTSYTALLFEVPHFLFFSRRWIAVLLSLALIGAVTFFNMYTRFTVRIRCVLEV